MGKGESQEWTEEDQDPRRTQPERQRADEGKKSGSCPSCCLKTRDCLMSNECGRALQISSVVAWCGMCIRMWVCECFHTRGGIWAPGWEREANMLAMLRGPSALAANLCCLLGPFARLLK